MKKKATGILKALQTADDTCKILTGRKLSKVIAEGIELFGQDMLDRSPEKEKTALPDFNDPYYIMGLHPDAPDAIVKASYRSWARDLHPDTGAKPDPAKFAKIDEAYKTIMSSRKTI
jgi:hypothetical protein